MIQNMCGVNKLFLAPEILKGTKNVTEKADVYSVGAILYTLIFKDLTIPKQIDEDEYKQRAVFDFSE